MRSLWLKNRWAGLFLSSFVFALGCAHMSEKEYRVGFKPNYDGRGISMDVAVQHGEGSRIIKVGPLRWSEEPPLKYWFLAIYAENYMIHYYDCSNKSAKYARILRCGGYDPILLLLKVEAGYHAILAVEYKGKPLYLDVTNGVSTYDYEPEFGVIIVAHSYDYLLENELNFDGNYNVDIGSVNWRMACDTCK